LARFAELQGFCDGTPAVLPDEHQERMARARALAKASGFDAFLVEAGINLGYLTGLRWGVSERPLLLIVPVEGEETWVAPAFEAGTLHRSGVSESAQLSVWQEHESAYQVAVAALGDGKRIALDPVMRLFVAEGLRAAGRTSGKGFELGTQVLDACRMVKSERELERLRRANEATKAAIAAAASHLETGMLESEFAALLKEAQQTAGLDRTWCLALFGPSAAYPHGSREDRALAPGDSVLVDTGGALHGYCSDISRTWCHGEPSDELRRAWDTVLAAQTAALGHIRAGVPCGDADAAARAVLRDAGYGGDYESFTHRLGHGIGLQGHERPYLVRDNATVLQPGMTMSDEPGIYRRGAFGVRIEDIIAVTRDGYELFGSRPKSIDAPFG
jgi:Xaa-Pro dipeptidase